MYHINAISCVKENNILDGFMLAVFDDENNAFEINYCPLDALEKMVSMPGLHFVNCKYSPNYKTLTGVPIALVDYPEINKNYMITKNKGLVLLAVLLDVDTNQTIGVLCTDGTGKQYQLSYAKAYELAKLYKPINFTVTSTGIQTPLQVPTFKVKVAKKQNVTYSSAKGESKPLQTVHKATLSNEQNSIGVLI